MAHLDSSYLSGGYSATVGKQINTPNLERYSYTHKEKEEDSSTKTMGDMYPQN